MGGGSKRLGASEAERGREREWEKKRGRVREIRPLLFKRHSLSISSMTSPRVHHDRGVVPAER